MVDFELFIFKRDFCSIQKNALTVPAIRLYPHMDLWQDLLIKFFEWYQRHKILEIVKHRYLRYT